MKFVLCRFAACYRPSRWAAMRPDTARARIQLRASMSMTSPITATYGAQSGIVFGNSYYYGPGPRHYWDNGPVWRGPPSGGWHGGPPNRGGGGGPPPGAVVGGPPPQAGGGQPRAGRSQAAEICLCRARSAACRSDPIARPERRRVKAVEIAAKVAVAAAEVAAAMHRTDLFNRFNTDTLYAVQKATPDRSGVAFVHGQRALSPDANSAPCTTRGTCARPARVALAYSSILRRAADARSTCFLPPITSSTRTASLVELSGA